jgi:CII-binding regulator of phage lambda lysogenization HflD
MPADVSREEFAALAQETEGEKLVTRHILEQTHRNSDDLAAIKTRLDRVESKIDGIDRRVDGLDRKVDLLGRKLDDLTKSLPRIVAEVVREIRREREEKR